MRRHTLLPLVLVVTLLALPSSADDVELKLPDTPGADAFVVEDGTSTQIMRLGEDGKLDVLGDAEIGGDLKLGTGRTIRQISVQTDSTTRNFTTTTWALGATFATIPGFKAGSLVRLNYNLPTRNDNISWGGAYIEPQISFDGGSTWNSLGSSGYDGGVMHNDANSIANYSQTLLIDPAQVSDFSVTVRFYLRPYTGVSPALIINGSHDINRISGTAPLMSGVNGQQHYTRIIVEELY